MYILKYKACMSTYGNLEKFELLNLKHIFECFKL